MCESQLLDFLFRALHGAVSARSEHLDHDLRDARRFLRAESTRGHRRCAETDAGGIHRLARIVRNRIFIERNARAIQELLRLPAGNAEREPDVEQDEMVVRTAGEHPRLMLLKYFLHRMRVRDYLFCILPKRRSERLAKRYRLCRDLVHMWPTLESREHRLVYFLRQFLILAHENHPAARAPQSLMRRRGDDVEAIVERILRRLPCDEPRDMRSVHYRNGAHFARDAHEFFVVELARVRRKSREDNFRLYLLRDAAHVVVINFTRLHVLHLVSPKIENLGEVCHGVPVGQVSAMREVHAEHGVAGF